MTISESAVGDFRVEAVNCGIVQNVHSFLYDDPRYAPQLYNDIHRHPDNYSHIYPIVQWCFGCMHVCIIIHDPHPYTEACHGTKYLAKTEQHSSP